MMRAPDLLRHLVELESPTGDAKRIAHIGSFLAAELAGLVIGVEAIGGSFVEPMLVGSGTGLSPLAVQIGRAHV